MSPFQWRDPAFRPFINWTKFYRMDLRSASATKARERLEAEGKEAKTPLFQKNPK